jgi:hypothetical protein
MAHFKLWDYLHDTTVIIIYKKEFKQKIETKSLKNKYVTLGGHILGMKTDIMENM